MCVKKHTFLFAILFLMVTSFGFSQTNEEEHHKYRITTLLSHSYIVFENVNQVLAVPTIGVDFEYWLSKKWGVGFFSDVEIITNELEPLIDGVRVSREFPVVLTLDALWEPIDKWEFVFGAGVELIENEAIKIVRGGVEYDLDIGNNWDIAPTFFYDYKPNGDDAVSIGIGIGKRF